LISSESIESPICAELFGVERLEQHAESLAAAQPVMARSSQWPRAPGVVSSDRQLPKLITGPLAGYRGRAARQEADSLANELLGIGREGIVAPTVRELVRFEGGHRRREPAWTLAGGGADRDRWRRSRCRSRRHARQ